MPQRAPATTPAQQQRDSALARVRRITWFTGIGAAALTAAASLVAATTIPGHSAGAAQQPSTSSPDSATPAPGTDQPPVDGGGQVQPAPAGAAPVAVSGGS